MSVRHYNRYGEVASYAICRCGHLQMFGGNRLAGWVDHTYGVCDAIVMEIGRASGYCGVQVGLCLRLRYI
jgi:hypothetical protein